MWRWINDTLLQFKNTFNNKKTFGWFVIAVIGLMVRTDTAGVTSIVRALSLSAASYPLLLHFFRSEDYLLNGLEWKWQKIIANSGLLLRIKDMVVMVGDGVKQSKEGRFMPGVKKLHQESENSAKGEYIFGHMFGGVGVIIGNTCRKLYCAIVSLRLHDGLEAINGWWRDDAYIEASHVVKIIKDAGRASKIFGPSLLLLDRLFLTVPMLKALAEEPLLKVVTKAKLNAKAFYHPKPKTGRGAPAKKGEKVKVVSLFESMASSFVTTSAVMYGKEEEVRYYCTQLLWGDQWYQNLKFVLVWLDGVKTILVSTDLTLTPVDIIELYCHRFKIECAFRELKQVIAGFSYRFWSKYMPKLSRFKNNDFHQQLQENIFNDHARERILKTVRAMESFTLLSCIALGLLQMISIIFASSFTGNAVRFMRTPSKVVPSEATVADFLRKTIYQLFRFFPDLAITALIKERQSQSDYSLDQKVA
jgi:hypothetical protein